MAAQASIHVRVENLSANISVDNNGCIFQTSPVVSVAAEPSIHVRVEHSDLDTLHLKIEDFTCQLILVLTNVVVFFRLVRLCPWLPSPVYM